MWWIALALTAAQPAAASPKIRAVATPQATATVRIVSFATVRMGQAATNREDLKVSATDTRFRDADGGYRPARIVELP